MPTEAEIVARIRKRTRAAHRVLVGIGDDAAVIKLDPESDLIACCDLMVEDVHFRSDWTSPNLLGHKALAVTLSDVAAMGAIARYAMLSVALPTGSSSEFIDEFVGGIIGIAEKYAVSIIGGDTSSSPGPLFIDTSVIGECPKGRYLTRSGARSGDLVYVTGELGASALGLMLLEQGRRLHDSGLDEKNEAQRYALMRHLSPEPRLKLGQAIGEACVASSMIDISDGLSTDLSHILEESGCGAVIQADAIPVADCIKSVVIEGSSIDPLALALHGGEEYELLFTSGPDDQVRVAELARLIGLPITAIGRTVETKGLQLERGGVSTPLLPSGFQHLI